MRIPFPKSTRNDQVTLHDDNKVLFRGLYPVGQILDVNYKSEFQDRGNEHLHAAIHVVDAPKIDVDDDEKVIEFIDRYIPCSIPNKSM